MNEGTINILLESFSVFMKQWDIVVKILMMMFLRFK